MSLEVYLNKHLQPASVKIYHYEIRRYVSRVGAQKAEQAERKDIMNYIQYLRQLYDNPNTIRRILHALIHYYHYLIEQGKRESHPCRYIRLRDAGIKEIQVQELLSKEELVLLLKREERYEGLALRNKMIMSLLVYQALRLKEIIDIQIADVNLKEGSLFIKATTNTTARHLPLKGQQSLWLYQYLNEARSKLLKSETDALILSSRGRVISTCSIRYLVETYRPLIPEKRLTATTIRQSALAVMLKNGKGLRQVQAFAGHRKTSTTAKYKEDGLEALKAAIDKYYPK
jgi:integrase/recombinase XerD